MNKEEIWKDISNYDGVYQISNLGRVKTKDRMLERKYHNGYVRKGQFIKPQKDKDGYLRINLYKNGKPKASLIHRLVAQEFISNPNNLPQINHINLNKQDNRVENLEWCTAQENIKHAASFGLYHHPERKRDKLGKFIKKEEL